MSYPTTTYELSAHYRLRGAKHLIGPRPLWHEGKGPMRSGLLRLVPTCSPSVLLSPTLAAEEFAFRSKSIRPLAPGQSSDCAPSPTCRVNKASMRRTREYLAQTALNQFLNSIAISFRDKSVAIKTLPVHGLERGKMLPDKPQVYLLRAGHHQCYWAEPRHHSQRNCHLAMEPNSRQVRGPRGRPKETDVSRA
jgi:hypothetical protein